MLTRYLSSRWAPWAFLAVLTGLHVLATAVTTDPFMMVDLKVYVDGTAHLWDGTLYSFFSEPLHLPFTYPPFSGLLFAFISWLPWTLLRILWQLASIAALAGIVHCTLVLLGRRGRGATDPLPHGKSIVLTATGLFLFIEPVRTTLNYGQINLFLVLLILGGAIAARSWLAGATVGLAAGIKLTPAITGLYYLLQRRWSAVLASVVTFVLTVAIGAALLWQESVDFFTQHMLDPARTGPVWSVINQSLRGALARLAGHDVSTAWYLAAGAAIALGLVATWWSLQAGDKTAALLSVQLIGLLVSPISWSHHWVWVVPILLWCVFGRRRTELLTKLTAGAWALVTFTFIVSILIAQQWKEQPANRPGWQSGLGTAYVVMGVLTLIVFAILAHRSRRAAARELSAP